MEPFTLPPVRDIIIRVCMVAAGSIGVGSSSAPASAVEVIPAAVRYVQKATRRSKVVIAV
jgi:hypothetical protein